MTILSDLLTEGQCLLLLERSGLPHDPGYHVNGLRGIVGMGIKSGDIDVDDVKRLLTYGELKT